MKIKSFSLKHIKNFETLKSGSDFGDKNILYSNNGQGKTNLSRFLNCISNADDDIETLKSFEAQKSKSAIEYKVNTDTESITQENNDHTSLSGLYVYNSDYLEDTIRSRDFSDNEVDGTLEIELGPEQSELIDLEKSLESLRQEGNKIKEQLVESLQTKVREIKEWDSSGRLTTESLDYKALERILYEECLLEKESTNESEGWKDSKSNFDEIKNLDPVRDGLSYKQSNIDIEKIDTEWLNENIFKELVFDDEISQDVRKHLERVSESWVRVGLGHCSQNECPFCLQQFSASAKTLIENYKSHMASEKAKFNQKIESQIVAIQNIINFDLRAPLDLRQVFELRVKNLKLASEWSDLDFSKIKSNLKILEDLLKKKGQNPSFVPSDDGEIGVITSIVNEVKLLNSKIENNNKGVRLVNEKLTNVSNRQTDLRRKMGKKYFVEFYEENSVKISRRDELRELVRVTEAEIVGVKNRLPSNETAEKIVQLFNFFLKKISITKYEAELEEGKITLKLENKHDISSKTGSVLSEGEKNAIGLCYFLASSIRKFDSSSRYSAAVIVIDDPVCSMSYKYFYGVCDVIKTFHNIVQVNAFGKNNSVESPQLFVFTHNIQFYNMLYTNIFKQKAKYYEIIIENNIHEIKETLGGKLSEYKTALKRIKDFSEGNLQHENIGGDIRRVLETICNFHGYTEFNAQNVAKVLVGMEGSLMMFAQDRSHEDINNFEDPFDDAEYTNMAKQLIDLITVYSPELIKSL